MRQTVVHQPRAHRRQATPAEARLWLQLRDRRLGGFTFRRRHAIGAFVLDFFCPEARLAVELNGGGHASEEQAAADVLRASWLEQQGIHVLRFWNDQVLAHGDVVLGQIRGACAERRSSSPQPTPRQARRGRS